ncbi:tetratricopeptide repeat protein [Azospirillum brasilense]|uniref:Tetratricopeptide repeat protein n=1 Tax=Azospirillum brasilense TaxID=192 RepID=A0A560AEP6_AZOBR|nr:glycosyltransferase [Azospirillum brasilense]TWA58827.1 tetratricopeptide repeat protein [Azospirillum brasilense]
MARDIKDSEGSPSHRPALLVDPADAVAWQHAALAARAAGDDLRAITLFVRAARLHGDLETLSRQIGEPLRLAASRALARVQDGAADEAAALLEPLARLVPPQGDLARALGVVRLVQGRDAEAEQLHAVAGSGDCGPEIALRGIARLKADTDFLGTVVIPAHRMEDTIERALGSVAAAARVYRETLRDPRAQVHICVVDDASPDETASRVLRWARAHPEQSVALIANNRNQGAGRSRNIGAAAGLGRYIWFLDADDYFFERHFVLTATALDHTPDAGFVRTGMQFDNIDHEITPAWREASELSYPCNLCVRRVCHDMIGGFPEEAPFHPAVADDVAYGRALHSLFGGVRIAEKTVHYTMRADNALARQRQTMTSGAKPTERATSDSRFVAIEILIQRRIHALKARRDAFLRDGGWTGPPFLTATKGGPGGPVPAAASSEKRDAPRAIDLFAVAREAVQAGQLDRAVAALTRAAAEDPGRTEAWFELGLLAHRLRRDRLALTAFRAVTCLHPGAAAAWCNLGSMLVDADAHAQAAPRLRRALALQPGLTNAQHLLGRANRRLGQDRQGARELERALRLDPMRLDLNADCADAALALGDAAAAAEHARQAVRLGPELYEGHAALAAALESLGCPDTALAAWERAIRCNPGFGEAFTRRALSLLTRRWGPPPAPAPAGGPGRRLASTVLGRNGRFANQLLQYGILRLYAARHGLTLEVPPWLGRHLYDHDDPLPGPALPRVAEKEGEAAVTASLRGEHAAALADRDVSGYFCGDTTPLAPFREEFRALFTPGRHLRPHADAVLGRLRDAGRTVVALHLRRGDFGWGRFWIAPTSWYLSWLETVWPTLDRPLLFIATDDPAEVPAFAAYRPVTGRDLAEPVAGAEFFTDFHVLCHADRVAISNSSFSFVATMLNRSAGGFHRPDPTRGALVPYDPWAAPVLI